MEQTRLKRQREEIEEEKEVEVVKRQKSYEDILSILDEEEDEPIQDLSSLITILQQEISSSGSTTTAINNQTQLSSSSSETEPTEIDPSSLEYSYLSTSNLKGGEEEDEAEKVMKHLLEASDDELGIPTTEEAAVAGVDGGVDAGDWTLPISAAGGDGLWEIEDEAANYYTLLQSELFL